MDPTRLKLELTESVVMAVGDSFTLLERLRELGISLALDDFGTGYSSLSYLKMLPIQQLKIDRSFVEGIGSNTGDEAIIRTVMELARSLGFEVVAEGVETEAQAAFLAQLGCEQLQGFLHGSAVAPAEFRARWSRSALMSALAWRLLGREMRSGELRLLFAALVVAVAAVTAVGFFADRVRLAWSAKPGSCWAAIWC
jgi:EAL domain-containing protein (putative c-di-GMP-specific phosphodiesterase class I)